MNPCPRYEESLILYSHQELGRKKVVTLQKRLSQCEKCRGYLDELNHVSQIVENIADLHPICSWIFNGKQDRLMAMIFLTSPNKFRRWSREIGHAVVVLILTISLSIFLGDFTFLRGSEAIYKGLFRFFRITLLLCLPLYLLFPIFQGLGRVVQRENEAFFRVKEKQELKIHPLKHWLIRPFQGIGIGLLFGMKLLSVLQVITGSTASAALLIPKGEFQLARFFIVTGITILVSLLLSALWTLDDMGIRYFNRKNHEVRMIGKYAGTFMPILFGFYGAFTLFSQFQRMEAFVYLFQIVVILYPPFAVFSVFHTHFLQKRGETLLHRLLNKKGNLTDEEEE